MTRREAERRQEARDAAIERSKEVRRFDADVARLFAEDKSVRETAAILSCSPAKVMASRVWQTLESGAGHVRNNSAAVRVLRAAANG